MMPRAYALGRCSAAGSRRRVVASVFLLVGTLALWFTPAGAQIFM